MEERLKQLRKQLDMTQDEFAKRIGLARNSIANYEIGRREPTNSVIISICREFKVNEEWLRSGTGAMFIELDMENQLMTWAAKALKDESDTFKRKFIKMLMDLNEKEWEYIENKAKWLVGYEEKIETENE